MAFQNKKMNNPIPNGVKTITEGILHISYSYPLVVNEAKSYLRIDLEP